MNTLQGKIVLVTGASSGIGRSTVELLLEAGATVYAAARRVERMEDLAEKGAVPLKLDVTDDDSMVHGIETILRAEHAIDILINNAGYGSYGAIEDVPLEEARRQFEVNIFGLARLTQLVLAAMRTQGHGKIVNISSIAGKIYSPFGGWYHATKHALEGFTDSLRLEVRPFGIDVILVEPGGIATEWGTIAADHLEQTSGSGVYGERARRSAEIMRKRYMDDTGLSDPLVIARVIMRAITARKPKTRYAAGYMARPALFMRKWLSDSLFDRMVERMM